MWSLTARKFFLLVDQMFHHYQADPYTGRPLSALIAAAKRDLDELEPEIAAQDTGVLTGDDIRKDPGLSQVISYAQA